MDNSSTPVKTSDAALRLKETFTDHNVNSVGSGVEVFSSATYVVPRVPSQTELCVTDASLPVSALLTPEPLQEANDGVTESLEKVMFGDLVQNKDPQCTRTDWFPSHTLFWSLYSETVFLLLQAPLLS